MSGEKKSKSTLIIWLAFAAEIVGIIIVFAIIINVEKSGLKAMPEQTAQVEVVKKDIYGIKIKPYDYCVQFKFKDGREKLFIIDRETYETIQENDTGTLFYKEFCNDDGTNTREKNREILSFFVDVLPAQAGDQNQR